MATTAIFLPQGCRESDTTERLSTAQHSTIVYKVRFLNLVCEAPMAPPCSPGCISGCISVFMLDHYPHCLTLTHSAFSLSSSSFLTPIGAMSAGSGVQAVGVAGRERV